MGACDRFTAADSPLAWRFLSLSGWIEAVSFLSVAGASWDWVFPAVLGIPERDGGPRSFPGVPGVEGGCDADTARPRPGGGFLPRGPEGISVGASRCLALAS